MKQDTLEFSAIEAAYASELQELFTILVANIIDLQDEVEALKRFEAGLGIVRRAFMLVKESKAL
jgi:hypothetical protein